MADTDFEQFRRYFDRLPQYIKAPAYSYTLVHDILLDEAGAATPNIEEAPAAASNNGDTTCSNSGATSLTDQDSVVNEVEEEEEWRRNIGGGNNTPGAPWDQQPPLGPPTTRRRRKLPEIPKNKKSSVLALSLADELGQLSTGRDLLPESVQLALRSGCRQSVGAFQLRGGSLDCVSSPESPQFQSMDADSGHSTTNSPDGLPRRPASRASSSASATSGVCCACCGDNLGLVLGGAEYAGASRLVATHRGLHKFVPRHRDEIEVEIGDPLYVQRECDDLWCEGVNMRTSRQGAFPSAYAVDLEYREFDPEADTGSNGNEDGHGESVGSTGGRRDRFLLEYLGSVESLHYKGNAVLCQAVRRVLLKPPPSRQVILEVSEQGLRMLGRDRLKAKMSEGIPKSLDGATETTPEGGDDQDLDYFYSLKNVSFCGFHPRDQRFLGFITKHPQRLRFACHVFRGDESMRPVAETIGRAFERFYQKFIETAYPTEDIYIE